MSTIADYSVFTKKFLASGVTDFSQLYGMTFQGDKGKVEGPFRAFAVIPFKLDTPLTPREAMNFDLSKFGKFGTTGMWERVSCRDADGNFIGNIVRVQPSKRDGSIRFVAKVAVPDLGTSEGGSDTADAPYNTFVLVRTDASTNIDLPIAVATISKGYNLHKHIASGNDPLDDVENANYVSFTINNLNGYTSVDFNPDAYATYDDVANALSRGIDGLHIAFDTASGDLKLLDKDGNVLDQANLPIKADVIIADGEEGYKYVKTDGKQDIHAAKAWMPEFSTAWESVPAVGYTKKHAALVVGKGSSTGGVVGITLDGQSMYTFDKDAENTPSEFTNISGKNVTWFGTKNFSENYTLKYGLEAFVWTVKDTEAGKEINDPFFQKLNESLLELGFHEGDDIALGTNLETLSTDLNRVDVDKYMHGKDNKAAREQEVDTQRKLAKEELVVWNAQHPELTEDREHGTIIDSSGLDVRAGHITLGCGRIGKENEFQKINYGIQMRERLGVGDGHNTYESLDFTVSHHTGKVQFDANGHAAQTGDNGPVPLTSSTLLSIEAGSYISGAPTCLILAEVTHNSNSEDVPTVFTPVRMTAGFSVVPSYDASSGLTLTLHDYRDNIRALLNPDGAPSIIEVQAIYTHHDAETVPAQQMHTYIGSWDYKQTHPVCSFLCNKIEEWMTAVGLADPTPAEGVKLYVVIRVY